MLLFQSLSFNNATTFLVCFFDSFFFFFFFPIRPEGHLLKMGLTCCDSVLLSPSGGSVTCVPSNGHRGDVDRTPLIKTGKHTVRTGMFPSKYLRAWYKRESRRLCPSPSVSHLSLRPSDLRVWSSISLIPLFHPLRLSLAGLTMTDGSNITQHKTMNRCMILDIWSLAVCQPFWWITN